MKSIIYTKKNKKSIFWSINLARHLQNYFKRNAKKKKIINIVCKYRYIQVYVVEFI